ncbi:cysteine desulfurase family protein [Novosphingobium sp.]|uniref:cysteine desulfurase family protein n=1 Tax=Novosphingobium sp. TaxID=1874826 RepID=UPI0035B01DE3
MIYLDYQATTQLAPEAREAMLRWLGDDSFGNPHSPHRMGRAAAAAVDVARQQVAALLPPGGRVVFTGSATEALNLALYDSGDVLTFATEHPAVLDCERHARRHGFRFEVLPVSADGRANAAALAGQRPPQVVAAMQVNNEIGTINPIPAIAAAAHDLGAVMLCDAVQGYGRIAIPDCVDLVAISAHKIHGPKGIGALWIRDGVKLFPLIRGGGQEGALRSGTLSPALCAGFGAAAAVAAQRIDEDAAHVAMLWDAARDVLSRWTLNGSAEHRWKGNLNLRLAGLNVNRLISECRGVMFAGGSACASGSGRPSHVLSALGLDPAEAKTSIRLGFGRYTSREDLLSACRQIDAAAREQGV